MAGGSIFRKSAKLFFVLSGLVLNRALSHWEFMKILSHDFLFYKISKIETLLLTLSALKSIVDFNNRT